MNQIRSLFDSGKDINRVIEKVITYQASQEQRLKGEISEYIVTESIEQQLEQLLEEKCWLPWRPALATRLAYGSQASTAQARAPLQNTSVWHSTRELRSTVSPSFARFRIEFTARPPEPYSRSSPRASRPPWSCSTSQASRSRASLAVSTVLYYKVLQYADYSRNLKVAALECRLRKGRAVRGVGRRVPKGDRRALGELP